MAITTSLWPRLLFRSAAGAGLACVVAGALAPRAGAADWTVVPTVRLRESYSDNIALAPPPRARDDFVTEVAPAILIAGRGARLNLNLAYTLQQLMYRRQPDATNHQLAAAADAALLEDWLYADARSSISRHSVSAFGAQAVDDTERNANQSTVRVNSVSPYLRHHFRGLATAELRYTRETVASDNDLLSARREQALLTLSGDNGGRGANWDLRHERKEVDDARLAPVRTSSTALSLRVPASSQLNLLTTAGHEDQGYASADGAQPGGRFWSAGAGWTPSGAGSLVASVGRRFFGRTYAVNASHHGRHSNWVLGYNEDITSTPGQFLRLSGADSALLLDRLLGAAIPDPVLRQRRVDAFLRAARLLGPNAGAINYFSHRYFLQKQLSLSMARVSAKSTLVLGLSATRRAARSANPIALPQLDAALENDTRQMGANAGWDWRLSARTRATLGASYASVKSVDTGRRDNNLVLSAGLSRALGSKLTASLDLRRVRHGSTQAGAGYRENAIGATLTFQL